MKPDWKIMYVQEHCCEFCGKHGPKEQHNSHEGLANFLNAYTLGLKKYDHDELCIVFDIESPNTVATILNILGFRIRDNHEKFEPGINEDILEDARVEFYRPEGSKILYLLLPDDNGKLPGEDGCLYPFDQQRRYADIIHIEYQEMEEEKKNGERQ